MWNPYTDLGPGRRRVLGLVSIVTVLAGWALVSGLGLVTPVKLPAPWAVASAFWRLAWDSESGESPLLLHTQWSVMRVLLAGGLVVAIGLPVGILMGASPRINAVLGPLVDPFRSAPVVALLPILVMWLGIGESMKIAFLFVGAVVFLVPMVRDAIVAVPQDHWISARDLGATPWEAIWHAVVPMAKPRIADAITVAISIMWTYITVAEFVNAKEGLGALIQHAKRFSAMDQVFVGIAVIIGLALVTHALLTTIKRRLYPWEAEG
jgi:ABC-type nitrate/sulfonate/bicarbonate transport system permease component